MLPYGNGNVSPHPVGADSISARAFSGCVVPGGRAVLAPTFSTQPATGPLPEGAFFVSLVISHNFGQKSLFTLPKVNFPAQFLQGFSTHFAAI